MCRGVARDIKEKAPVDDALGREGPEAGQVGKDGKPLAASSQLIVAFDL